MQYTDIPNVYHKISSEEIHQTVLKSLLLQAIKALKTPPIYQHSNFKLQLSAAKSNKQSYLSKKTGPSTKFPQDNSHKHFIGNKHYSSKPIKQTGIAVDKYQQNCIFRNVYAHSY